MKKGRLYNREEIELISKSSIGKSLNDILNEEVVTIEDKETNKGGLGQLVEKYLFGMDNNSDSGPDFMPAGIELKVTPYKKLKDGKLSAKERLVLNIIDYMNEYKNEFDSSHFWFKNNTIQLLWYLWEPDKEVKDLKITHEKLLELAKSDDLKQIEEDWKYIVNKIKNGKAHELSEADTMYLGACTKGANASSLREQPYSDVKAMQRALIQYRNPKNYDLVYEALQIAKRQDLIGYDSKCLIKPKRKGDVDNDRRDKSEKKNKGNSQEHIQGNKYNERKNNKKTIRNVHKKKKN